MHTVSLVVGDWSRDGHNMSETIMIEANMTNREIEKAYKKGVVLTGIDLSKECNGYEQSQLSEGTIERLKMIGIQYIEDDNSDDPESTSPDEDGYVSAECFAYIYLTIARVGSGGKLDYSIIKGDDINIGGYGLFSS